jgi:hypothetical protein
MPILKKKNKSEVPSSNDLAELDGSVEALTRQTKELLKDFDDASKSESAQKKPQQKPPKTSATHTKKKAPAEIVRKSKARSFDIIHPSEQKKLSATLKASPKPLASELLPAHAADAPFGAKEDTGSNAQSNEQPSIVHSHASGALNMVQFEKDDTSQEDAPLPVGEPKTESDEEQPASPPPAPEVKPAEVVAESAEDKPAVVKAVPEKEDSTESADSLTESTADKKPATEHPTESHDNKPKDDKTNEESSSSKELKEEEKDKKDPIDETLTQIYANNDSKLEEPERYESPEGQELPTVFDTSEYHAELGLHDWSHLEKKQHVAWYILLLLVVVVGALAYLIFSGTPLPFIN